MTDQISKYSHRISVGNSTGALTQIIPEIDETLDGVANFQPGYDIFNTFTTNNETFITNNDNIILKDLNNNTIINFIDPINSRYIFPSNVNTYGHSYKEYSFRINLQIQIQQNLNASAIFGC